MTRLRTMWGLDLNKIARDFGKETLTVLRRAAEEFVWKGWAEEEEGVLYLTREGKSYADKVISGLFFVDKLPAPGTEK